MSISDRPPRVWGRALPAVDAEHFATYVAACRSPEHLAAAMAAERGRPGDETTRPERIERLQTRLSEVQA